MSKINPFNPNYPVNPGMFVGRLNEVLRLESYLIQTIAGQPTNFIITGERGIGKTSLMNYLIWVAQGAMTSLEDKKFNYLVIATDIDRNTTQFGLMRKIEVGLRHELAKDEPARAFLNDCWDFLNRVEVAGTRIHKEDNQDETILEQFSYSLSDTLDRICLSDEQNKSLNANYDGIIILIDESDNASPELDIGSFFKTLLERLQRRSVNKLMVGLVGLTGLREVLSQSHPSSLRLFDSIVLGPLSNEEVGKVIDRCLDKANTTNSEETKITEKAKKQIISLSEGYPHFIQQFGYSAFNKDSDNLIDNEDVFHSAFGEGGALELIGDRYYRDAFYNKIRKDSYRQVLRIMAEDLNDWVRKSKIREEFRGKDTTLDNAIRALRERHIILSKEGTKGVYRLQHKGFALWIKFYTIDPSQLEATLNGTDEK